MNKTEYFGVNNALVSLELTEREKTIYSIFIDLPTKLVIANERRFNLVLDYNISYDVSVQASVCGRYNSSEDNHLFYGEHTTNLTILH